MTTQTHSLLGLAPVQPLQPCGDRLTALAPRPGLARAERTPFSAWPGTGPDDKWPQTDDRERQRMMAQGTGRGV